MSISTGSTNGSSPPAMWGPTVDLATARPVVFALARAPKTSDDQPRTAVAELLRLSDQLHGAGGDDGDQRPWIWLRAVAVQAAAGNDHHLAAACLLWAFVWSTDPRWREDAGSLPAIRLDLKLDILAVGIAALSRLPVQFVIVGTGTDEVRAGPLLDRATTMLEP
jgi:hypothetical protein